MNIRIVETGRGMATVVDDSGVLLKDEGSALDFMASVMHETGCDRVVLKKEAVVEDFFKLKTGIAGSVLQKFANYGFKLAIVGDFSVYDSKPLKDFIYECNSGKDIFFVSSEEEAVGRLTNLN